MNAVLIVDERDGLAFNHRPPSRDGALMEDLKTQIDGPLYATSYFGRMASRYGLDVCEEQPENEEDWVLFDHDPTPEEAEKINKILLYRFMDVYYPADERLSLDLSDFTIEEEMSFEGTSHDEIVREVLVRNAA